MGFFEVLMTFFYRVSAKCVNGKNIFILHSVESLMCEMLIHNPEINRRQFGLAIVFTKTCDLFMSVIPNIHNIT